MTVTTRGFYHKMWDTQMGEETFGDAGTMSGEQLRDKLRALRAEARRPAHTLITSSAVSLCRSNMCVCTGLQVQRLEAEALKRGDGNSLDKDR